MNWQHFSRRGFLMSGAAALTSFHRLSADPGCVLMAEQEEGPYYVSAAKLRGDITEGKPGVPLKLRIALVDSKSCTPLANAAMDIWHCDASGVYSGFTSASPDGPGGGGPGGPPPGFGRGARKIDATRFLRGVQVTNGQGMVDFETVYPGWYSGRAIHIHMKVHLGGASAENIYNGGHVAHTGQFFFPEDVTEKVAKLEPYARRLAVHRTTQEEDMVFGPQHGSSSTVKLERVRPGSDSDGFIATVTLGVDPDATPAAVGGRGGGRGRGGPGGPPPFNR